MNILITTGIYPPDVGGPARFVPLIAEKLSNKNNVKVITLSQDLSNLNNHDYQVIRILRKQNKFIRFFKTVFLIVKFGRKSDIIFINGLWLETKLLNYEINIMTDQEDSERRQIEFKEKTDNFVKNLELDETLGQLLVAEGFSTIDDLKDSSVENLLKIDGIEDDTAKALIERAKEFYQKDQEDISKRIKDLGLADDLINLKGLTPGMLVTLGEKKILNLEDFADLASDELTGGYDIVKGERVFRLAYDTSDLY